MDVYVYYTIKPLHSIVVLATLIKYIVDLQTKQDQSSRELDTQILAKSIQGHAHFLVIIVIIIVIWQNVLFSLLLICSYVHLIHSLHYFSYAQKYLVWWKAVLVVYK